MSTILVVDDDESLLQIVGAVLEEPGYTVLTATNGYEAIRLLVERHVDLMLTDIKMPGLDGRELAEQARLLRPQLQVIYISGAAQPPGVSHGRMIEKPVRPAELVRIIREQLSA